MKRKSRRTHMLHSAKKIALTEDRLEKLIHGEVLMNKPYETIPLETLINKQTKEKEMPDIKSELSKVLNQWDKHEETIRTPNKENPMKKDYRLKITNNVSRETFNYVRDNPAQTRKNIVEALTLRGFKEQSVDALLAAMSRNNLIKRNPNGAYFAQETEYRPIKAKSKKQAPQVQVQVQVKTDQPSVGIAALASDTSPNPTPAPRKHSIILNRDWTPDKAIENLNVMQARALYDKLKTIFGA